MRYALLGLHPRRAGERRQDHPASLFNRQRDDKPKKRIAEQARKRPGLRAGGGSDLFRRLRGHELWEYDALQVGNRRL